MPVIPAQLPTGLSNSLQFVLPGQNPQGVIYPGGYNLPESGSKNPPQWSDQNTRNPKNPKVPKRKWNIVYDPSCCFLSHFFRTTKNQFYSVLKILTQITTSFPSFQLPAILFLLRTVQRSPLYFIFYPVKLLLSFMFPFCWMIFWKMFFCLILILISLQEALYFQKFKKSDDPARIMRLRSRDQVPVPSPLRKRTR